MKATSRKSVSPTKPAGSVDAQPGQPPDPSRPANLRVIKERAVEQRVGLCRSSIYVAMKSRDFPKPIRLGGPRAVGWIEAEVDAWIAARIAERDAQN